MWMMNSFMHYFVFIFFCVAGIFALNSCTEEVVEISSANKILADSIIRVESKLIIKEIDSLCALSYQNRIDDAIDSVSRVRLKEIEKYIPSK